MGKESFVLVSLKEDKAKKLAQVITNDSCKKILEYLTEKEASESEISKKLNVPISTVHYNLQQLVNAGLVLADEYHYSEKGKEVNHYKLANKYIIIAPKSTWGIKEKLKGILPAGLIAIVAAGFIQVFSKYFGKPVFSAQKAGAARDMVLEDAIMEAAPAAAELAQEAPAVVSEPSIALWFLIGALFVVAVYLIVGFFRKK